MIKFKRTIFKKLVLIFVSLQILSFLVTAGFLYYFLNSYGTEQQAQTLEQSAKNIKNLFIIYWKNADNPLVAEYFKNSLSLYSLSNNSIIWIVDQTGHIYIPVSDIERMGSVLAKYTDSTGYPKLPDTRQYEKVMQGGNTTVREIGNFFGFFNDPAFEELGNSWLTVEMPFQLILSDGKQVTLAVYLHTPIPQVQKLRGSVFNLFMISGGVAIFLAIILIYLFSLRFTRPLKQINQAAKIIAGGEFRKKLYVKSDDEIGQLADSFNQMADDLQRLEELRRGFIANVSHELRTPMTSIRGFIEGILDGTIPPDKQHSYLMIVRDETNRLNRLVNDLLDLAKMESGEMQLNKRPFDINELIRICVIKQETIITSKNIEIEANFEVENLCVNADRDSIERVIINLLHNAVKFSNENGKIVFETSKNKDKVLVSISDNGIGIDEEELKRVWDRFYKSDKSRGMDKTGTGLGLAIVKNIITEHNQDIWVESKIGEGTKFTFTLEYFKKNGED